VAAATAAALVAFASNSILCRIALHETATDPASFTTIRLAAGAAMLLLIGRAVRQPSPVASAGSWLSAAILCIYAVPFSLAYTQLTAGTGALILFGSVQATMFLAAWRAGERLALVQWTGFAAAAGGLVYLVLPGLAAPPLAGALLMAAAGCAWGLYSLRGRGAAQPLRLTASNFVRALPMAAAVSALTIARARVDVNGALLATASGAVASGLGYVAWYTALRRLSAMRAAAVQLAVPILAAAGGVLILGEVVSLRLVVASAFVLGGIVLTLANPRRAAPRPTRATA
jgi:drug/metabolite transporter (DMT)-like permease